MLKCTNKDKLDKERVSFWGDKIYKVKEIQDYEGQSLYKLDGFDRIVVRSNLLLID